jgi:hypothetical protein
MIPSVFAMIPSVFAGTTTVVWGRRGAQACCTGNRIWVLRLCEKCAWGMKALKALRFEQ